MEVDSKNPSNFVDGFKIKTLLIKKFVFSFDIQTSKSLLLLTQKCPKQQCDLF
jgi:hypothetical protein